MSNTIQQPVIWMVQKKNNEIIREFEQNGEETLMTKEFIAENKKDFKYIALVDCLNNLTYSINLENGKVILGEQEFGLVKEHRGSRYSITNLGIAYNEGVIQYKCSKPILVTSELMGVPIESECNNYNIGYKIELPETFLSYPYNNGVLTYKNAQVIISVDADSLQPDISLSFTAELKKKNGHKQLIRV